MNVVVTGLSTREEAAFGIFLGRAMRNWSWQSAPASRGAVLPKADLIVADLVPLGLGQWSEASELDLLRLLQGTPAVLLLSSNNRTWAAMDAQSQHSLVWLAKPYGTKEMQAALEKAAAAVRPPTRTPVPPVTWATPPAPTLAAPPIADAHGLTAAELHTRLATLTEPGRYAFLRQLSDMLAQDHPFEARFTVQNSLIVHPADGWIATNTPMRVIERVCLSDAMASAVSLREMDNAQAEERAQRLGMQPCELDVFLFDLVAATLDNPAPYPSESRF